MESKINYDNLKYSDHSSFGDYIRTLRESRNYTQKDVADQLGMSSSGYGCYERGEYTPTPAFLVALANFYRVSSGDLLKSAAYTENPALREGVILENTVYGNESVTFPKDAAHDSCIQLSEEERVLLHNYRKHSAKTKQILQKIVRELK